MSNCTEILTDLANGENGIKRGMTAIYTDDKFRHAALYCFRRFPKLAVWYDWEDVFTEGICRFVAEIQKGNLPKKDCAGFFKGICHNICHEYWRKHSTTDEIQPDAPIAADLENPARTSDDAHCREKLLALFDQLTPQCRKLLWLTYLDKDPTDDKTQLAAALGVSEAVIPAMAWRCKQNLSKIIGNTLDDCFADITIRRKNGK